MVLIHTHQYPSNHHLSQRHGESDYKQRCTTQQNTLKKENNQRSLAESPKMYVQVRFELIYMSEISYLTINLHEKA